MAIDPKLVSIKTAAELPSGIPTPEGEFLYYENNELKKAEMSDLYDRVESAYLGIITPSSTIPSSGSWYGTVLAAGTFNNVTPAITVDAADFDVENGTANNEVRIIISDGIASKDVRRVKGDKGDTADPAKLPLYSAIKSGNIVAGTQFIDDENGNLIYKVKTGQTLLTTDIISNVVGTKVDVIGVNTKQIDKTLSGLLGSGPDIVLYETKGINDVINGVTATNNATLYNTGGYGTYTDVNFIVKVWKRIGLRTTNGAKITSIEINTLRYSSIGLANVIGIKPDGTYDVLLAGKLPADTTPYTAVIDVSQYVEISIGTSTPIAHPEYFSVKLFAENTSGTTVDKFVKNSLLPKATVRKASDYIIDLNTSRDFIFNFNSTSLTYISLINDISATENVIFNLKLNFNALPSPFILPDSFQFASGVAPSFEVGKSYILVCQTYNFGVTWDVTVVGTYPINTLVAYDNFKKYGNLTTLESGQNLSFFGSTSVRLTDAGIISESATIAYINLDSETYTVSAIFKGKNLTNILVYQAISVSYWSFLAFAADGSIRQKSNNGAITTLDSSHVVTQEYNELKVVVGATVIKYYLNNVLIGEVNNINEALKSSKKVGFYSPSETLGISNIVSFKVVKNG